jgi:hypothetical protein
MSRGGSYVGLNNLEFRVRNSPLGYRGSIYMWWRPTLKCRRLGRRLGAWHAHAQPMTREVKLKTYKLKLMKRRAVARYNHNMEGEQ